MKALVSTVQYLLLVDLSTHVVTIVENERPEYYGISWFQNSSEIVLSHSGLDNNTLIDLVSYSQSEVGWLSRGRSQTAPFLSQPHQILCCSDGRVVCTNTGRNRLVAVDLSRPGHFQEVGISDARWDRLGPNDARGDHLNSVFEHNGRLYAIAHGLSRGSSLATFSYPEMDLISIKSLGRLTGLHNIFLDGDLCIACHSEAAAVIELSAGKMLWEAGAPIYTRGLAATGDFLIVGGSEKSTRFLRRGTLSELWVISMSTWRSVDYIPLGYFGAVHEVRIIDEPDRAHHGVPLKGWREIEDNTLMKRISSRKIQFAESAYISREIWSSFEMTIEGTEATSDGWRAARSLSLAIRTNSAQDEAWAFDFVLDPREGGQVGVVLDYQGRGGDTNMKAFILKSTRKGTLLTLWHEAGTGWASVEPCIVEGLANSGRCSVKLASDRLSISVDGRLLVDRSWAPSPPAGRGAGIRWANASVRPYTGGCPE